MESHISPAANRGAIKLDVYYDYVCPWCYVGQGPVERLKKEYGVAVEWKPFYLHPEWPEEGVRLPAHARERFAETYARLKKIADSYALPLVASDTFPNSRRALEASEFARECGKYEEFHHMVFRKIYGEGQDISRWDVLRSAAGEIDIDPGEMQRRTDAGEFHKPLNEQLEEAESAHIYAVPTYIIGDTFRIQGAQSYEVFVQRLRKLLPNQDQASD